MAMRRPSPTAWPRRLRPHIGVALQARKAALECERLTKRIHDLREFNENERQVIAPHKVALCVLFGFLSCTGASMTCGLERELRRHESLMRGRPGDSIAQKVVNLCLQGLALH